jgi:hypothetical protein
MHHRHQRAPLFIKEVERGGVIDIQNGFERDFAAHHPVVSFVDNAHASAAQNFAEFIAILKIRSLRGHLLTPLRVILHRITG